MDMRVDVTDGEKTEASQADEGHIEGEGLHSGESAQQISTVVTEYDNSTMDTGVVTEQADAVPLTDAEHEAAWFPVYDLTADKAPYQLAYATSSYQHHFLKGCKWCKDGSSLLVGCDDKKMRVYKLPEQFYTGDFAQSIPEMEPSVTVKEGGTIYDYCWFPLMDSQDESTCCFITTTQNTPIHLWDSNNGNLISTYRVVNHLDEIDSARSVAFSPDGTLIYSGFVKQIHVFDVSRPGRQIESFKTHKKRHTGQTGIISCFDFLQDSRIFAAGSYSRSVALYDQRNNRQTTILEGHSGGVTQIKFSHDGNLLLSGARKDNELLIWDMRNPGQILAVLQRSVNTNQRIMFDIDPSGRYVCSGGTDGIVTVWDLHTIDYTSDQTEQEITPTLTYTASADDCVNSASFHPSLAMITTSSGQRSFKALTYDSDSESDDEISNDKTGEPGETINNPQPASINRQQSDNSVRLWWIGP